MLWEEGVLEISKKYKWINKKLPSLGENLDNFLEKHIWMSSSVVKLQASL